MSGSVLLVVNAVVMAFLLGWFAHSMFADKHRTTLKFTPTSAGDKAFISERINPETGKLETYVQWSEGR